VLGGIVARHYCHQSKDTPKSTETTPRTTNTKQQNQEHKTWLKSVHRPLRLLLLQRCFVGLRCLLRGFLGLQLFRIPRSAPFAVCSFWRWHITCRKRVRRCMHNSRRRRLGRRRRLPTRQRKLQLALPGLLMHMPLPHLLHLLHEPCTLGLGRASCTNL